MANRFKGEIETSTGHKMVLDYNALAEFESIVNRPALDVLTEIDSGRARFADVRALFLACLLRHNPDLTINDAGDIASEDPDALSRAVQAAQADPQAANDTPSKSGSRQKKVTG